MLYEEEADDYSWVDVAVLRCADKPRSKTKFMQHICEKFDGILEHGPYLYGEYSDDADESMMQLQAYGALDGRWQITDYGRKLLEMIRKTTDDPDQLMALEVPL